MKCLHTMVLVTILFYLNLKHSEIMTKEERNQHFLSDLFSPLNFQLEILLKNN